MIKIYSTSPPLVYQVDNYLPSITGQVRWNGYSKYFEVCDNSMNGSWTKIDNSIQLSSDPQLVHVLEWAKKKMIEEQKLEKLANEYPAVKSLKEKLDLVCHMVASEISKQNADSN